MTSQEQILDLARQACFAAERFAAAARRAAAHVVVRDGRVDAELLDVNQRVAHGYAWVETTVAALRSAEHWARTVSRLGTLGEVESLVLGIGFGEYLAQLLGGIGIGANEFIRPRELGIEKSAEQLRDDLAVAWFLDRGNCASARQQLIELIRSGASVAEGMGDETLDAIRTEYRRFVNQRIVPHAQRWHLDNALIPDELIAEMSALGTFGVCIDPAYGGLGLGKLVMCVVTEELSRGWIGAGSLGTRSEIAGELIASAGTPEQKSHWLPRIAAGDVLPTAVFTEPNNGSDLATLRTRATRLPGGGWTLNGRKTWITHAARSDLMTLLARTDPDAPGYAGLSMFLLPKARGTELQPFPTTGIEGTEIGVLGYRGMREYDLAFQDFVAAPEALLGSVEGQGFKQLMQTFEGARIQTAARAVGVAQRAYELGLRYACERTQFRRPLIVFPRVSDKLALMIVEITFARELTYAAARRKDEGHRCDIEAGMAKLLSARTAWLAADASLQIHGGNGYALESQISRILCDARILNIFEGAAEIQAQVIARGKLS